MAHTVSFLVLLSLVSLGIGQSNPSVISVTNGSPWGNWGRVEWCPEGYVAKGFSIKAEEKQGRGDDTAVNGFRLHCVPRYNSSPERTITSTVGPWGGWTSTFWCPSSYLVSFSLRVEEPQGRRDDTAVNNIMFRCSDNRMLEGTGLPWGSYGPWSQSCQHGICGILTKVEGKQGDGDDTALNDIQCFCCSNVNGNN
ncbi:vitelline membrane outer layer protein 1-like [Spea bombifrons]|uniref:vitelline membrane outer layer protein 1-like n=1 Tax=Spea bombifrons TaxID=233779 RepID=UPI00234AB807|nr:vitelline membrane outer layer protein 1-like [Spea bombifrons]